MCYVLSQIMGAWNALKILNFLTLIILLQRGICLTVSVILNLFLFDISYIQPVFFLSFKKLTFMFSPLFTSLIINTIPGYVLSLNPNYVVE